MRIAQSSKVALLAVALAMGAVAAANLMTPPSREVPLDEILDLARQGALTKIEVSSSGDTITAYRTDTNERLRSPKAPGDSLFRLLKEGGANIETATVTVSVGEGTKGDR